MRNTFLSVAVGLAAVMVLVMFQFRPDVTSNSEASTSSESSSDFSNQPVAAAPVLATPTLYANDSHDHEDAVPVHRNAAANFFALPVEQQKEIRQLSGRFNQDVKPIEIKPGVFMMPEGKRPMVVPVAVMNEDGTVSIYEY